MFWVLIIILILFATGELPKVGRSVGGMVKGFKDGYREGLGENPNERPAEIIHEENDKPNKPS